MAHPPECAFAIYTEERFTRMATQKANRKTHPKPITAEVRQFMHFNREGDVIPHGWNKKIGRWHDATKYRANLAEDAEIDAATGKKKPIGSKKKVWRSRPFAERLLARIIWFYTPSPVKNDSGKITGWKRKFKGPYWQLNTVEMADSLGCSTRTIREEIALLKELKLIKTQLCHAKEVNSKKRVPLYVIPIFEGIVALTKELETMPTDAPDATSNNEESSYPSSEDSSQLVRKNLPISYIPPLSDTSSTSSPHGEIAAGASPNQNPTQPLEERKEVKTAQVPPTATAPARAPAPPQPHKPDPSQVRQADDLIIKHAERKAGGKLTNWDITKGAIESAIKGNVREDKAAIDRACKTLAETISEIVNDYQWRFWPNRKSAMQIIELDLHLDDVVAYVRADCDSIAAKYKDREGYGMENALQAVRIALAALGEKQKKVLGESDGEYYEIDGELRWRPKQ